jgi:hypothetical protein
MAVADSYPASTVLNSSQVSLECATALGATVAFLSDGKAQKRFGFSAVFMDSKKYAIECREKGLLTET